MAPPKDMLELRLEHAATPERVARATRMLADILEPLIHAEQPPTDGEPPPRVTVVVSNFDTKASVRVWDPAYEPHVQRLAEFLANPDEVGPEFELAQDIAVPLAKYARDEGAFHPSFWTPGDVAGVFSARRLRSVDADLADKLERLARQPRTRRTKFMGATFVQSKILRVGRKTDDGPIKARILLPSGDHADVEIEARAIPKFEDAYATRGEHRVKILADWVRVGDRLELDQSKQGILKMRAVDIDERVASGSSFALLSLPAVVGRDEAADLRRHLRGEDDDEE